MQHMLAVLTYICIHGTTPMCLAEELLQPVDLGIRTRLRSPLTTSLPVRRTRLSTVGDRAFPVAAARTWNHLPRHVTSASSLPVSQSRLNTHLFRRQCHSVDASFPYVSSSACKLTLVIIVHFTYLLTFLPRGSWSFSWCLVYGVRLCRFVGHVAEERLIPFNR